MTRPSDILWFIKSKFKKPIESEINQFIKRFDEKIIADNDMSQIQDLINEIKTFCEIRNIIPIFILLPVSEKNNFQISVPKQLNDWCISNGIHCYNYWDNSTYISKNLYLDDGIRFNQLGLNLFNKELKSIITNINNKS